MTNGSPVSGYQDVNGGSYQLRGLALVPNGTGSLVAPPHLPDVEDGDYPSELRVKEADQVELVTQGKTFLLEGPIGCD